MTFTKTAAAAIITAAFPFAAIAQSAAPDMFDRNVYQQQRIEQGLRDGSLSVQEAAALQRGESRISQMESRALADGRVSDAERQRINEAQNRQSAAINRERGDSERGDPNSRSAQRMQADVQRNINEQRRIERGVESGQITNREAARLQAGQSRVYGQEARAGADGHINRYEQRGIQGAEHHQSRAIHHERNDRQSRGWNQHGANQGNWDQRRGDHANNGNQYGQNRDHGNNGNHFGQVNRGTAAAPVTGTSAAPASTGAQSNNGNHYGQSNQGNRGNAGAAPANRGTAVAQAGGGRGNRR